ncbi:MAG: hypothetical protein U0984_13685 [Prosthecobacter sp.]|nr:hypothetical protein [Prosthecobacter sp.]
MSEESTPQSEIILYQTEDGRTRVQVRLQDETVWLTQKLMAELFDKDVRTINEHIQNLFDEGELAADSVIRKFRILVDSQPRLVDADFEKAVSELKKLEKGKRAKGKAGEG